MLFLFHALGNQLLVPWFKDVEIQVLAGIYYDVERKDGDEVGHGQFQNSKVKTQNEPSIPILSFRDLVKKISEKTR